MKGILHKSKNPTLILDFKVMNCHGSGSIRMRRGVEILSVSQEMEVSIRVRILSIYQNKWSMQFGER